jgi:threonyl-tRNA synthetase
MPGRFGCEYVDKDGGMQVPVLIHAAIFGSYERMIGTLLEHYAGRLPTWLAPVQVMVLPIADRHLEYAAKVAGKFSGEGVRVEVDKRSERLTAKIRDAHIQQIPIMLLVGDKEQEGELVSLRRREGGKEQTLSLEKAVKLVAKEIDGE